MAAVRRLAVRGAAMDQGVFSVAKEIMTDVRKRGDAAVRDFTLRHDGCVPASLKVPEREIRAAGDTLDGKLKKAIRVARENILRFHGYFQAGEDKRVATLPGVECFQRLVPIERVGLYVPGGGHPLFSSLLMLGIPAGLAGCDEVIVCTPPGRDGQVHPAILYCAHLLGIRDVFRIGGAQAVAAMAYGTGEVGAVDKIFGPGNPYVTAAKLLAARDGVAVDMPAGPSELLVVADGTARPEFVSADLLGQLEHGEGSRALLVSLDGALAAAVKQSLESRRQAGELPSMAAANLADMVILSARDRDQALEIVNAFAPEHLCLAVRNPEEWIAGVRHAGSVFLGHWAPEAAGDYATGTNHTLPTGGHARAWSGVSVRSFQKSISFQQLTPRGLLAIAETVEVMAAAEKLPLHADSVAVRRRAAASMGLPAGDPRDLLSRRVRNLEPYSCARRDPLPEETFLLDANEMPVSLTAAPGMNRYPDSGQSGLSERISAVYGWPTDRFMLGNGSDELIDILVRGFCDTPRDRVLITPPTYGMYGICAASSGIEVLEVPLAPDFKLNAPAVVRRAREGNARLIFLCSPNNPSGNLVDRDAFMEVVRHSGAAVVMDEAYIEFSGGPGVVEQMEKYANILVLRTFSKSWGAAGARLGILLGHRSLLRVLRGLRAPYSVSTPNRQVLERIMAGKEERDRLVSDLIFQRDTLARNLESMACVARVHASKANFLLVEFFRVRSVLEFLVRNRIRVRDCSGMTGCSGCLRVSVGTDSENRYLLKCLNRFDGGEQ